MGRFSKDVSPREMSQDTFNEGSINYMMWHVRSRSKVSLLQMHYTKTDIDLDEALSMRILRVISDCRTVCVPL